MGNDWKVFQFFHVFLEEISLMKFRIQGKPRGKIGEKFLIEKNLKKVKKKNYQKIVEILKKICKTPRKEKSMKKSLRSPGKGENLRKRIKSLKIKNKKIDNKK